MLLNPKLYDLLVRRFGGVRVLNRGEPLSGYYLTNVGRDGPSLHISAHGESYFVCCPFCNDTRFRLSLNHRYGSFDPASRSDNLHLARCFNEDCLKAPGRFRDLASRVFGLLNVDRRRSDFRLSHAPLQAPSTADELREAPPPGDLVSLVELPDDHEALAYLRERGFDAEELDRTWNVTLCVRAADRRSYPAQDRLVIPIIREGVWVGWQARHVGRRDYALERVPKYFTMPSFPKRSFLYNHDLALTQPLVVVCEGPTDVWRVGAAGVALLGKQASREQRRLLAEGWKGKPVVVLLDGDARADAQRLCRELRPELKGGLVNAALPGGKDPGGCTREELWELIREEARCQGVELPQANEAGETTRGLALTGGSL